MDASQWDARYAESDLVWSKGPNVFVERELADLPPGRALDLAGGEGRNARWLAGRGWEVELVEFSQVALDKARALAEGEGVTITGTLADLTAEPDLTPADVVIVAYLQLPREATERALRTAASAVTPGGTLLIVAHALRNLHEGVGGPQDPAVLRTVDEVVQVLVGGGLVIEEAEEVLRAVDTDDGPRDAIDLLVRAVRPASSAPEPRGRASGPVGDDAASGNG